MVRETADVLLDGQARFAPTAQVPLGLDQPKLGGPIATQLGEARQILLDPRGLALLEPVIELGVHQLDQDLAAFDAPRRPTVFIAGERDSTRLWLGDAIERQAHWLPGHTGTHVIPGCGHWVQQERPDEVNALLLAFLDGLTR